MVPGMSGTVDDQRRATRLLRWYPKAWRESYGEEFVDHLEQEFADRAVDLRRTLNVVRKGLVARADDLGLWNETASPEGRPRAVVATSFVLTTLIAVLALNFWSTAMLHWSARTYHPIPVSATTGILFVIAALLILFLAAVVLIVVVATVRQLLQGHGRPLVGPSIFAVVSGGLIFYAVRRLPRMLAGYSHLFQGGFRWTHPGPAMYGLAAIANDFTQPWVSMWRPGVSGGPSMYYIMNDLVPLALLVFGVAIALLLRRVDLPPLCERFVSTTVTLIGAIIGALFITYIAWLAFGGPSDTQTFWPVGQWGDIAYLIFLAIVAVLLIRTGLRVGRLRGTRTSNLTSSPQR
jgi:hypothetical protein